MEINKNTTAYEYLAQKSIVIIDDRHGEYSIHCPISNCDADSRGKEAHFHINKETGQYHCKKCGEQGNLVTLAKRLGDTIAKARKPGPEFNVDLVEKFHQELSPRIRQYLNERGVSDEVINRRKIGYGKVGRYKWITIPLKDGYGNYCAFKLRSDPEGEKRMQYYPAGATMQLYGWECLKESPERVIICEGELDCLVLETQGVPAVTSTGGTGSFTDQWVKVVCKAAGKVYICQDNDEPGRKGAEKIAEMIEGNGAKETYIITLPEELGMGGDITDYFRAEGTVQDLFGVFAKQYPEQIDTSDLVPMTAEDVIRVLGLTIKHDDQNKLATFLCMLSAYTDDAQINISFNAPSSTGKSYIAMQTARLFPREDVRELGYSSPTAFFHDNGEYDKETNTLVIDLERKILLFLDQPHNDLLARLRPMLSHDSKAVTLKITDKSQKGGLKTKTVVMKGYPAVVFCTAGLNIDEQESTRFLLLSPEINEQKIREGVRAAVLSSADSAGERTTLEANKERALLKKRIKAIKLAKIRDINIPTPGQIERRFMAGKSPKPRHQRDIKRLMALIKAIALLNLWHREKTEDSTLIASQDDIDAGFRLWDQLYASQELSLPPYAYSIYHDIILPAWEAKIAQDSLAIGLTASEIQRKHYEVYGRHLSPNTLRQQILPVLEQAGLIVREFDPNDRRNRLVRPTINDKGNVEDEGGVKDAEEDTEAF